MIEDKNRLISDYIIKIIRELNISYKLKFTKEQVANIIEHYTSQDGTVEEIKQSIDNRINRFITNREIAIRELNKLKEQLKPSEKANAYFGEVYKTYIIHILDMYEKIINSNIPEESKQVEFDTRLANYLKENKIEMNNFLFQQTSNERLISLAATELYRGSDSLSFETVKNLYDTFLNDINIVSNDCEGKMYSTIINNQRIFEDPVLDENGNICINPNIKYNFDMIKETYDFAKKHGKQIKFHTFLWHNAVPENLKKEIDSVGSPRLKREMALAFLRNYASSLSKFFKENGYDLRQFEALNEIASDKPEESTLRDSWWKDIIGNNPENGDEYFIDVLKIVKENFPNTEIIYNEYNEFIGDKTDKIVDIIEQVKAVEQRDGITLLDGIGLQAHYSDYIKSLNRPLTPKDIVESAVKLQKACEDKKIYITEYDFLDFRKNGSKEELEHTFIEAYSKIANGFIMWGNSNSLTWYHCVDKAGKPMNAQIIDSDGKPKEVYEQYREAFLGERKKVQDTSKCEIQPHHNRFQGDTNDGR